MEAEVSLAVISRGGRSARRLPSPEVRERVVILLALGSSRQAPPPALHASPTSTVATSAPSSRSRRARPAPRPSVEKEQPGLSPDQLPGSNGSGRSVRFQTGAQNQSARSADSLLPGAAPASSAPPRSAGARRDRSAAARAAAARRRGSAGPVDVDARQPELAERRGQEGRVLVASPWDGAARRAPPAPAPRRVLPRRRGERVARPDLQEDPAGLVEQLADRVGEAHGAAELARPVGRDRSPPRAGSRCRSRSRDGMRGACRGTRATRRREGLQDRVHHRRVEGVRGVEPPALEPLAPPAPRSRAAIASSGPETTQRSTG